MEKQLVEVDKLTGAALDYALKVALKLRPIIRDRFVLGHHQAVKGTEKFVYGEPSKDQELLAFQMFNRDISMIGNPGGPWVCSVMHNDAGCIASDTDKLNAISKIIVKMEIGEQVEVPVVLLPASI